MNLAADDPEGQARNTAFVQALQQLGWTDGRNARIDTRCGTDAGSTRKETGFARPRRHPGFCERSHERIATDDPRCADRIRDCDRSGRCRIRRNPGSSNLTVPRIAGADVRQQALRRHRVDCIVDCEQAVRGFGREYFFSTFQSARGILEPSRTVLDATATKWSLDVAQMTSRLDYQKMETMAESARRVGSLSPSLT
jgi:hypothetical protein